jgi:GT2 family glycosyltransferase
MKSHADLSVAVVICAYTEDRWNLMMSAITSVLQQTRRAAEVILVIDHNSSLLSKASFEVPRATVIANGNEKGLSGARNAGVAAATADIVAFLDDDAFAAPNWLAALVEPYSDPGIVGVGGHVTPVWFSGRPGWFPSEFDWVVGCTHRGMPVARSPVRNFVGANMSIRRGVLIEAGGFDVNLGRVAGRPSGCEETELCIRVHKRHPDGVLLYEPAARVRHHVPDTRSTWQYFRSRCFAEGMSKAIVCRLAGPTQALSAEKQYLRSVVPRGLIRALGSALRGDRSAALTVVALCAGVVVTAVGYLIGSVRLRRSSLTRHESPTFGRPADTTTRPSIRQLGFTCPSHAAYLSPTEYESHQPTGESR